MISLKYNGAEMCIAELGAEMRAFTTADGRDWIWRGSEKSWKSSAPVLFPAIGTLKDGGATIAGDFYAVPRHGFAKFQQFEVLEQGEDYISMILKENEETKKVYPFDFAFIVTYRFLENGFETRFTVENHSSREMPFLVGGHPAFNCPMKDGEQFEDYILYFEKEETIGSTLCPEPAKLLTHQQEKCINDDGRTLELKYSWFDRYDTYILCGLNSRSVDLIHRDTRKGIRFSYDMPVLAVWSMPNKCAPYVCLEPWQGCPAFADETGRFEDKPYHVSLGVGETFCCGYKMEIID